MFAKFFKKDAPPPTKPIQPDQSLQHEKILHEINTKYETID
jgi:hypothetical protein